MAPLRSRSCPISRQTLTFTHGEISQKKFRKFFASRPALTRRNPQKPALCPKLRKTPDMLHLAEIFPKIFSKFFPKIF